MAPAATQDTRLLNTDTIWSNTSSSMIVGGSRCALGDEGRRQLAVTSSVEPRARCSPSSGPVVALSQRWNIRVFWTFVPSRGLDAQWLPRHCKQSGESEGEQNHGTDVSTRSRNKPKTNKILSADIYIFFCVLRPCYWGEKKRQKLLIRYVTTLSVCFHVALMLAGSFLFLKKRKEKKTELNTLRRALSHDSLKMYKTYTLHVTCYLKIPLPPNDNICLRRLLVFEFCFYTSAMLPATSRV